MIDDTSPHESARVNRRGLLRKAGAASVFGTTGLTAVAGDAAAADWTEVTIKETNDDGYCHAVDYAIHFDTEPDKGYYADSDDTIDDQGFEKWAAIGSLDGSCGDNKDNYWYTGQIKSIWLESDVDAHVEVNMTSGGFDYTGEALIEVEKQESGSWGKDIQYDFCTSESVDSTCYCVYCTRYDRCVDASQGTLVEETDRYNTHGQLTSFNVKFGDYGCSVDLDRYPGDTC